MSNFTGLLPQFGLGARAITFVTRCLSYLALVAVPAATSANVAAAQPIPYDIKANYTKNEVMIPMRDGVKLFTIIYEPRAKTEKYPILITRTAYGIAPYGPDQYRATVGPNNNFAKEGYIVVYQDSRGKFKSEGDFVHHRPIEKGKISQVTDMYDTIDWLVKNVPNNNGRVGQWGISWGGWEVSQGMIDAHPALKASSPQSPPQDQFLGDDHHSGGAFQLMYAFQWMSTNARARNAPSDAPVGRFDYGTVDGWDFFLRMGAAANARQFFADDVPTWNDYMIHGTYDEYWKSRNVPKDLKGINHPVLLVGTWFDAQDFWGPFRMYDAMVKNNPNNLTYYIVGPWLHGGYGSQTGASLGNIEFGSNTGQYYRDKVELPFFNYYLKDKGAFGRPKVEMFETGRNVWRSLDSWPLKNTTATKLYFGPNNTLTFTAPTQAGLSDSYVSDPAKPVPYSAEPRTIEGHVFMVEDQRFAWTRPDVLYYQTEPLTEDITIAGPITAFLNASTSGTDADFVVKLIDVYPGDAKDPTPNPALVHMSGFQMLLAGDILRAKFRTSFEKPTPMVPNAVTKLEIPLGDKYHTFLKGHRIMVQVQSSWFPMFDRNPQTFVDIYHAKPSDYRKATQRIMRAKGAESWIGFSVLKQ
jgi:putative CocE/NonD family hydrolase